MPANPLERDTEGEVRQLDAKIAEKVMGWGWVGRNGGKWFAPLSTIGTTGDADYLGPIRAALDDDVVESGWWLSTRTEFKDVQVVPRYSTDIAAAWTVVEKMRERGYWFGFDNLDDIASAWFEKDNLSPVYGNAAKAPRAIVLAALAALESV